MVQTTNSLFSVTRRAWHEKWSRENPAFSVTPYQKTSIMLILCLGGGEFDNVTQNLGGEFSTV